MTDVAGPQHDAERRDRYETLVRGELLDPLRRYLARRTDAATADDALAETLLVVWRRLEDVPEPALPWAYGVARRCLANADRSARRQGRLAARVAVVDPPREAADAPGPRDDTLHEALAALRPDDAELLRLWAWEQVTAAEIAVVLGVSANAVSVRLTRARDRLRGEIGKIEAAAGHEGTRGGPR